LHEIAAECVETLRWGVPLEGICLYPILDRFDWEDNLHWHNSGLWDMQPDGSGGYERILNKTYAAALKGAQQLVARTLAEGL
jgi:hypothetical protein